MCHGEVADSVLRQLLPGVFQFHDWPGVSPSSRRSGVGSEEATPTTLVAVEGWQQYHRWEQQLTEVACNEHQSMWLSNEPMLVAAVLAMRQTLEEASFRRKAAGTFQKSVLMGLCCQGR